MKFLEKFFIALAIVGLFLRVMMLDWGEFFLTVALPSLAVIYILTSWAVFKHRHDGHHVFLSFLSGLSFGIVFIGILFKLMVWRGGNVILIAGLSTMLIFKLIGLLLERVNVETMKKYFKMLFIRYYIKAAIALIFLFIPYKTIVSIYHRDDPEYVRLYIRYFDEPNNKKYRAEFFEHRRKVFKEKWKLQEDHKH